MSEISKERVKLDSIGRESFFTIVSKVDIKLHYPQKVSFAKKLIEYHVN